MRGDARVTGILTSIPGKHFPTDSHAKRMGIADAGGDGTATEPRPQAGVDMICKESAKSRDYFDTRAARRSRLKRIPATYTHQETRQ